MSYLSHQKPIMKTMKTMKLRCVKSVLKLKQLFPPKKMFAVKINSILKLITYSLRSETTIFNVHIIREWKSYVNTAYLHVILRMFKHECNSITVFILILIEVYFGHVPVQITIPTNF